MLARALSLFVLASSAALAAVAPTSPSGETVLRVGQEFTAQWVADTTGQWTNTVVQLMTGNNQQMTPLMILSPNIDGTTQTRATWTVPNVTPNSKIYFLQFTRGGDVSSATWTTRFTIASADGSVTPPPNSTTEASGVIQWGVGQLVGANGQPIPATGSNTNFNPTETGSGSGSGASPSASGSAASGGAGAGLVTTLSQAPSASPSPNRLSASAFPSASASSSSSSSGSSSGRPSGSASAGAAAVSSSRSAAGKVQVVGVSAFLAGLVGVAFA